MVLKVATYLSSTPLINLFYFFWYLAASSDPLVADPLL